MIEDRLHFFSGSADKPPGQGVHERVADTARYAALAGVRHWRRMRALQLLAEALRRRRHELRTRWRRLDAGRQALLVLAYLRKGETYADLAYGFGIGVATVYREGLALLAALDPRWSRRSRSPGVRRT